MEDVTPIKQLHILNQVCRILCGKRGTALCQNCRVEELRQELFKIYGEELRELGEE